MTRDHLVTDHQTHRFPTRLSLCLSLHRSANAVGAFIGPLAAGLLAQSFGWRVPFFVFTVPTMFFVVLAWRLSPPVRGAHERRAMGARSEEHTSELQSLMRISYAVFCLKKKNKNNKTQHKH